MPAKTQAPTRTHLPMSLHSNCQKDSVAHDIMTLLSYGLPEELGRIMQFDKDTTAGIKNMTSVIAITLMVGNMLSGSRFSWRVASNRTPNLHGNTLTWLIISDDDRGIDYAAISDDVGVGYVRLAYLEDFMTSFALSGPTYYITDEDFLTHVDNFTNAYGTAVGSESNQAKRNTTIAFTESLLPLAFMAELTNELGNYNGTSGRC